MEEAVLNSCVTLTNETPCFSNTFIMRAKSIRLRESRASCDPPVHSSQFTVHSSLAFGCVVLDGPADITLHFLLIFLSCHRLVLP
jgi:hypothetical protein